ncbi:MAG: hypothetical protein JWP76_6154 [Dactylosporangium sp.]|jgi:hypothetical protein|nr:hypothetical protein [Dactylosporangium sp.]
MGSVRTQAPFCTQAPNLAALSIYVDTVTMTVSW